LCSQTRNVQLFQNKLHKLEKRGDQIYCTEIDGVSMDSSLDGIELEFYQSYHM